MKEAENNEKQGATAADIGTAVRKKRKEDGLTLADAAALCGVGYDLCPIWKTAKRRCRSEKSCRF